MITGNATLMYSLTRRCRPAGGYFVAVAALSAKGADLEPGIAVAVGCA